MLSAKSRLMQLTESRVTDGELLDIALSELEKRLAARNPRLQKLAGIVKGGKRSSASEIDGLVYGG